MQLFGKPGCSLCEEAADVLDDLQPEFGFELDRLNILTQADWFEKYRFRVPVIVIDGKEVASLSIDRERLEAVLHGASS